MMTRLCLLCLFLTACVPNAGSPSDGFDHKDAPDTTTTLRGQALREDGTPVARATVYLVGAHTQTTKTDAETGEFVFPEAPVGPVRLILNDGQGAGSVLETVLFEGGTHDTGELRVTPLESFAQIVDIQGVGFEERLSREAGDYKAPVYASDASFVIATRRKGGESTQDIVRLDTMTGVEEVLLSGQSLRKYPHGFEDRLVYYRLYEDRFLVLTRLHDPKRVTETIVFDIDTARALWSSYDEGFLSAWTEHIHRDGRLYMMARTAQRSSRTPEGLAGFDFPVYQTRVDVVELATGAVTQGPSSPFEHEHMRFLPVVQGRELIARATPTCQEQDFEQPCSKDILLAMSLDNLTYRTVTSFSGGAAVSADGAHLYLVDREDATSRPLLDVTFPGAATNPRAVPTDISASDLLASNPDGTRLLFRDVNVTYEIDLLQGTQSSLVTAFSLAGATHDLCTSRACQASYLADGTLRIVDEYQVGSDTQLGVITDPLGASPKVRTFDIGESGGWSVTFDMAQNVTDEAFVVRDPDTGFLHIHLDDATAAPAPRTFLTADHTAPRFSQDGTKLFYFTRDPISGYEQLFRLDLTTLPALP